MAARMSASLPNSIKVGPFDFAVVEIAADIADRLREDGDIAGYTIHIGAGQNGPRLADTVLHEVLHAIYRVWALSDADDEERTVTAMTTGLVSVLRDNPQFTKWLSKQTGRVSK